MMLVCKIDLSKMANITGDKESQACHEGLVGLGHHGLSPEETRHHSG